MPTTNTAGTRPVLTLRPLLGRQPLVARRHGLIPELVEQVAGRLLELGVLRLAHLPLPDRDSLGVGGLGGERVSVDPLARLTLGTPLARGERPGHLLQALLGPLVVGEHRRVVVELDQLADAAEDALGVLDQVLVPDLEIAVDLGRVIARLQDPLAPSAG